MRYVSFLLIACVCLAQPRQPAAKGHPAVQSSLFAGFDLSHYPCGKIMHRAPLLLSLSLLVMLTANVSSQAKSRARTRKQRISVVPNPVSVKVGTGSCLLSSLTGVTYQDDQLGQKAAAEYLVERVGKSTGHRMKVDETAAATRRGISLVGANSPELGDEGYTLSVKRNGIRITANGRAGFFYAVQSLLQLLPPQVFGSKRVASTRWAVACVEIKDYPRFTWRGMHLDVSRHFLPKEFIKTYIDMLAMHKLNIFHWHLTDDQGWRIEIKKYPKLSEVAAWRVDREDQPWWGSREPQRPGEKATYGGFYTQDEIREIVRYAASRNITIVPEIEMPAHTTAVLAAYPQFSCTGGPFSVPPGGVWPVTNIFCAGNDSTFAFLQDVLTEVMDLFPGPFIHIGGDEANKKEWKVCPKCQARINAEHLKDEAQLQSYFVSRIGKFVNSKNRRLIGWDEILEGGIAPNAVVMSWRGTEGGIAAARKGHDAVMTPISECYFWSYQGRPEDEPLAAGGYLPISRVYAYEPVPASLTPAEAQHVLGAQGCLWSEFVPTPERAEYMVLPRISALAEAVWSPREKRDWADFADRLEHQMKRYEASGYVYAQSAYSVTVSPRMDPVKKRITLVLANELGNTTIYYTLNGNTPTPASNRYTMPIAISRTSTVSAASFANGILLGKATQQKVYLHKASFRPVRLMYPYEQYTGGGEDALVNGLRGSLSHVDGNWQGFHQNDLDAIVDLGKSTPILKITTGFLEDADAYVFLPTSVSFSVSEEGEEFIDVAHFDLAPPMARHVAAVKDISQDLSNVTARFVRVKAKNIGICPDWHMGRGDKAWLMIDEILVE